MYLYNYDLSDKYHIELERYSSNNIIPHKHFHSFLMKKKGQYSYSYHVNKLCENLKEEPSSYNTKSFHGSSDFVVLA